MTNRLNPNKFQIHQTPLGSLQRQNIARETSPSEHLNSYFELNYNGAHPLTMESAQEDKSILTEVVTHEFVQFVIYAIVIVI